MAEAEDTLNQESEQPRDRAEIMYPSEPPVEEVEETAEVETPEEQTTDSVVEETAEVEETITPASEENPPEGDVEDETDEVPISSFSQLIETEDFDPEWANNLTMTVKVDGVESEASIADLVKNFQIGEAAEKRLDDAKVKVQAINQELAQQGELAVANVAQAAGLIQLAERLFGFDAQEANLAKLREDGDDVGYLAAKDRLSESRQAIEQVKREAANVYQQQVQDRPAANQQADADYIAEQQTALIESIPEWKADSELAAREAQEMLEFADSEGIPREHLNGRIPALAFRYMREAMFHRRHLAKVQTAKKRVVTIPKVLKPGANTQADAGEKKDAAEILYGK